ncbi:hypothetical protein D3C80_2112450 [compost metagenome]
MEKDILRIAVRSNGFIKPVDLVNGLGVDSKTIKKCMTSLCEKGKFKPVPTPDKSRICRYEYIHSMLDNELW